MIFQVGVKFPFKNISNNYNVQVEDCIIFLKPQSAGLVVNLPAANQASGRIYTFINTTSLGVSILPNGTDLIQNLSLYNVKKDSTTQIVSDSLNWYIV